MKTKPAALRTDRTSSDRPLASDTLCQQPKGACPRPWATCSHHLNHIFPSRCVGHSKQLGGGSQENTPETWSSGVIWSSHEMSNVTLLFSFGSCHGFPCGSVLKNPSTMQEMQVRSLGEEDPLEEGKATHSSILAWRIPWTEEPGGLQSMGSQRVGHD